MHQYLTYIGGFPIRFYGIFFALGILSGCIVAYFLLKKDGRGWEEHMWDLGLIIAFSGILGGRLWDVFFFDWEYYGDHLTELFNVWQGGMAIQGGLIFASFAAFIYLKRHKIPVLPFADIVAPAVILGQSVGRIANFMNGDAFGHPTGGNFGLLYPETTLAYHTYGAAPLWPAEVWECQGDLLIFVALLLFSCGKHTKGAVFCLYVMLYSALRFFLEYFRGDYDTLLFGLKSAQLTSITAFTVAALVWMYLAWRERIAQ